MTTKVELTNWLIQKYNFKSYLEIGVQRSEDNYSKINCQTKVGVDPDPNANATFVKPSDEFFKTNTQTFDIILIDGLHHWEQVYRDIENSIKLLNDGGVILMHDCNPTTEAIQIVPMIQSEWTGYLTYNNLCSNRELWLNLKNMSDVESLF